MTDAKQQPTPRGDVLRGPTEEIIEAGRKALNSLRYKRAIDMIKGTFKEPEEGKNMRDDAIVCWNAMREVEATALLQALTPQVEGRGG